MTIQRTLCYTYIHIQTDMYMCIHHVFKIYKIQNLTKLKKKTSKMGRKAEDK